MTSPVLGPVGQCWSSAESPTEREGVERKRERGGGEAETEKEREGDRERERLTD